METEEMQQAGRNPAKVNTILPDDIIEEILSRLPAKSLLGFRSVHKQWLSLISDPNFVQSHLKRVQSNHPHNKKLMILYPDSFQFSSTSSCCESYYQFCSIDHESPGGNINVVKFNLPVVSIPHFECLIFGSCNGLLCIGIYRYQGGVQFIIWNPLLKNYKQVTDLDPYPRVYPLNHDSLVGFGYDSVADDYKLVSVDLKSKLVIVYTLKSNSSRSFPLEPPGISYPNRPSSDYRGKLFNGSLYWLAYNEYASNVDPKLIWFDLKDEKFRTVNVPWDHNRSFTYKKWGSELIVAGECLCIVTMDANNLHLKLLMMKVDNFNAISWSSGPNLEQLYGLRERPISITNDSRVVMHVKDNFGEKDKREERLEEVLDEYDFLEIYGSRPDDFSSYKLIINNPHKGTVENIPVQGLSVWYEATTYIETLVSPI